MALNHNSLYAGIEASLRAIPELVAGLNGEPERIMSLDRVMPPAVSKMQAITEMAASTLLIVHMVSGMVQTQFGWKWRHDFRIYLRAETLTTARPEVFGYHDLYDAIVNGKPNDGVTWNGEVNWRFATLHPACDPVAGGAIQQTSAPLEDWGAEHWYLAFSMLEHGD